MAWNPFKRERSEAERSLEQLQAGTSTTPTQAPTQAPTAQVPVTGPSFTMPVEDVFTITGRGTVVTGQISEGTVVKGQQVTIAHLAGGTRSCTVTGIESFRKLLDTATVGDNVGLLLSGVTRDDVARGDVVSA